MARGFFETIRWKPPEEKLKLHYERLEASAVYFGIPHPCFVEFLKDIDGSTKGGEGLYVKFLLISNGGDQLRDNQHDYGDMSGKLLLLLPALLFASISFADEYAKDVKERTLSVPQCNKHIW